MATHVKKTIPPEKTDQVDLHTLNMQQRELNRQLRADQDSIADAAKKAIDAVVDPFQKRRTQKNLRPTP